MVGIEKRPQMTTTTVVRATTSHTIKLLFFFSAMNMCLAIVE